MPANETSGPLSFLSKKSWHPTKLANQEAVWKREQAIKEEARRTEEVRRELEEERRTEELYQAAHDGGHAPKKRRLEWMYVGGPEIKDEDEQGIAAPPQEEETTTTTAPQQERPEVAKSGQTVQLMPQLTVSEKWSRLNGDPLMAIKQREISALQALRTKQQAPPPATTSQPASQPASQPGTAAAVPGDHHRRRRRHHRSERDGDGDEHHHHHRRRRRHHRSERDGDGDGDGDEGDRANLTCK